MKTYLGTNEQGERVYADWKLKAGKFTCGMEVWNLAGDDLSMSGRITEDLAEDFPDNEQLFMMSRLAKYHLNDMNAGSPKQRELIDTVIGPAYEKEKTAIESANNKISRAWLALKKGIEKARLHSRFPDEFYLKCLQTYIKAALSNTHEKWSASTTRLYLGNRGVSLTGANRSYGTKTYGPSAVTESNTADGRITLAFTPAMKLLVAHYLDKFQKLKLTPTPDRYNYICDSLEKLGRLHDPDLVIDGVAYRYGRRWLKEELPSEVVEEINSWVEVEFTGETPLQILCKEFEITSRHVGFDKEKDMNHFKLVRGGAERSDFWAGTGIEVKSVTPEQILGCVISDAREGKDGLDTALEYCDELGYSCVEGAKIAQKLCDTYDDLEYFGVIDRAKELGIWGD